MPGTAAFLVVLHPHAHPDQVEDTIAAARQLKGVAGISTLYDEHGVAKEILGIRDIVSGTQADIVSRARRAGGA